MEQNRKSGRRKLCAVLCCYLAAAAAAMGLSTRVKINYDISDYLPADTQTAKAIGLIDQDFGMTGSIQVMASGGVTLEQAKAIKADLESVPHVLTVSFDGSNERYYRDGAALFSVLIDGDDYSENARRAATDIRRVMDAHSEIPQVEYGGTAIRKQILQNSITQQMVFILALSLCLVVVILLITSRSWLEPLILLAASGVAVLLNRGTNLVFGEISYITNSIAAILQLALSIDYSIVLLHTYRSCRTDGTQPGSAMRHAVRQVVRPVSASALTTVAGLLALLFMRFRVGFDIGIVLMKGIVISALTSLTLLPVLVLLFEKPMERTAKRAFVPQGRAFVSFAKRAGRGVIPVALAAVIVCGVLQAANQYTFSDRSAGGGQIEATFGRSSTVVLIWQKTDRDSELEAELTERIGALRRADGSPALSGATSYSGTALAPYDRDALVRGMGLSGTDADALLALAALDRDPTILTLTVANLRAYLGDLLSGNVSDPSGTLDADRRADLQALYENLEEILPVLDRDLTAGECYAALPDTVREKVPARLIAQLWGMPGYAAVADTAVSFRVMLGHLATLCEDPALSGLLQDDTAAQILEFCDGVEQAIATMETPTGHAGLRSYCAEKLSVSYTDAQLDAIFAGYFAAAGTEAGETAPLLQLLVYMADNGWVMSNLKAAVIRQYQALYDRMVAPVAADAFFPTLREVVKGLTGSYPAADPDAALAKQVYLSYFVSAGVIPETAARGWDVIAFLAQELETDTALAALLPEGVAAVPAAVCNLHAAAAAGRALDWVSLAELVAPVLPAAGISSAAGRGWVRAIYVGCGTARGADLARSCPALELVSFLQANAEGDPILSARLTAGTREQLSVASAALEKARSLFRGETCTRMLLSVDLPTEGTDSEAFVSALGTILSEVVLTEAYAAGELISTYDLASTFSRDNLIISVFTLVSVFLIVLVLFRSISLPVLLVSVIQGAIFIAMATMRLTDGIFFMSYIVSVCILMGATIDYGILMSSSYLDARRVNDRGEALRLAVAAAMPTVFSSGLILTVCGFVIHFISTQDAISTVGLLLGVGTVSSVLMITLVLPSLLFFLDRFVLRWSWKK